MQVLSSGLCDVKLLSPQRHQDDRGWFAEMFNAARFQAEGLPSTFVQDNQSFSRFGTLRGLHYQLRQPQGKLIRVLSGHIWDVVVDLRRSSPDFGRYAAFALRPMDEENRLQMLWIPEGFAHGFLVLSPTAEVLYKVTRPYDPGGERTLLWNDPALGIPWPLEQLRAGEATVSAPILSPKDAKGVRLGEVETF